MPIFFRQSRRIVFLSAVLFCLPVLPLNAQNMETKKFPSLSGTACDEDKHPLAGVQVTLESTSEPRNSFRTKTDAQGRFEFQDVPTGTYHLRSDRTINQGENSTLSFDIQEGKPIALQSCWLPSTFPAKDASIQFSDEPQFTVAGVTDTTALGVHASSRAAPNSNALAKDTVALSREGSPELASSVESSLRARLATTDDADLRFQLAEMEENNGRSLEAEKDYQRAAELAPTEAHIFGWAAELLLHRAFEPALEVFSKGNQRYPRSVRMLLGLGATHYAQGSREEASQYFLKASEIDTADPQPYLFLGRLLPTENPVPPAWTDALKRFVALHPENAMAHYLYGLALAKRGEEGSAAVAEARLNQAIAIDPRLGNAYLELGILRAGRKDFPGAVTALQKAAEYTPFPDEAHYRLAEVYRRMGDAEKARQESARYKQIAEQKSQQEERERHEIQQFIYTLRGTSAPAQSPVPKPQ